MQDSTPTPVNDAAALDDVQLTPKDEAAIEATAPQTEAAGAFTQEGADRFVRTIQRWIDDAAAFAHNAVDKAASTAAPLVAKASATASGEDVGTEAASWLTDARATVRSHPLAAVGIAAAAGVVLSLLMSSSSSDEPEQR